MQRSASFKAQALALCALLAAALLPAALMAAAPTQAQAATAAPTLTITRATTGKVAIKKGTSYKLGATATSGAKITYKSSKKSVAAVTAKGLVKARKAGKATITVKAKKAGKTTTKKVKVTVVKASKYKAVKKVAAKAAATTLYVGKTTKLTATVTPSKASNKNVTFKSSNAAVAFVDAYGTVTARKAGTATITATSCANAKKKASVKVTVKAGTVPVPVRASVNDYSWAELKAISNKIAAAGSQEAALAVAKGYNLVGSDGKLTGDECKTITVRGHYDISEGWVDSGTSQAQVQILGFYHDNLASGGKAGITFGFKDIVGWHEFNSYDYDTELFTYADGTTGEEGIAGGWANSQMRSWLNSDFYATLPADLKAQIVAVQKMTNNKGHVDSEDPSVVSATTDKVWLLSMSECYGVLSAQSEDLAPYYPATYDPEGTQYQLYSDNGVNVSDSERSFLAKSFPGNLSGSDWWLRSPNCHSHDYFHGIRGANIPGYWYNDDADYANGVSPGFCL